MSLMPSQLVSQRKNKRKHTAQRKKQGICTKCGDKLTRYNHFCDYCALNQKILENTRTINRLFIILENQNQFTE